MKKPNNNKKMQQVETSAFSVSAALEDAYVLKYIVQELVDFRSDLGYADEKVESGWQAIDTSSIEAYASGYLSLAEKTEKMDIPFDASFLFTCTKPQGSKYDLKWASSLS